MKPYYVFSVEGQSYLIKLVSNHVYAISEEERQAFHLFEHENKPLSRELTDKYNLDSITDDWEPRRKKRWDNLFARRNVHCIELMVSQECNMRCEYCYGNGSFGGNGFMNWSTAKQAVDWLLDAVGDLSFPHGSELLISFFGGEPLLNYPLIQKTIEYVWDERKRRDVLFSITTNLSLLTDDMLDFFVRHSVGLCISFDGEMQHKYRPFVSGEDSYDTVVRNIKKVLSVLPESVGRATLYGDGDFDCMADSLREIGFTRGYINAASGSLIKGTVLDNKDDAYKERIRTYPALAKRYLTAIKQRDEKTYRRISFDSEFMQAVGFGWNPVANMMSCGCGRTLYTVNVEGDIYPCHRFVGIEEMKLGNINQPFAELCTGAFSEHVTFLNPQCKDCFLRFTCGGSCMHENYCDVRGGEGQAALHIPFKSFCEYRRLATELAIHIENSLDKEDKAWLRLLEHGKTSKE